MEPIKISAERARIVLGNRDWVWSEGYWRPTIATVDADPAITPGNYTMEEALKFYGYILEED